MRDLTYLARWVAQYFISLELAHDAGQLTRMGAGRLTLDLLGRRAMHQHRFVPFLRIGHTLRHRIADALAQGEDPGGALTRAELEVECRYRTIPPNDTIDTKGITWCGETGPLIEADLSVTVRLGTADHQWQAQHAGVTTWPERLRDRP
ncbi:MAG TPA: hypothetical protein VG817_00875 [Gemmatimonadales bacterium]|nr:hypothetical protein [Gemmatimonadales bacterium]